ncbi:MULTISPECIES: DUF2147 domain-containing protein [unclassified Methylobacterium]|uniref:DUF2147 domain-containing protein n=1 Tax=unclassified Methylobacterium TaxID=2615210 RepID=UPI001FCDCB93|nr:MULTISPECIES: DUF2147 domain-containing protein [unclassified Methylobacterium]
MRRAHVVLAATLLAGLSVPGLAVAQKAADATGMWLTEGGDSKIRIGRCGGGFCGTIASTSGTGVDSNNPDASLKNRSLVGVQIMNVRSATADGYDGTLYNPKDGKTYSGSLKIKGPDTLEVAGCVMSVFCKRQTWKRVN